MISLKSVYYLFKSTKCLKIKCCKLCVCVEMYLHAGGPVTRLWTASPWPEGSPGACRLAVPVASGLSPGSRIQRLLFPCIITRLRTDTITTRWLASPGLRRWYHPPPAYTIMPYWSFHACHLLKVGHLLKTRTKKKGKKGKEKKNWKEREVEVKSQKKNL